MLDGLKFWKKNDDFSSLGTLSDDPMSNADPLAMPDPLSNQSSITPPGQHSFPDMDQGSSFNPQTQPQAQPQSYQPTTSFSSAPEPETYKGDYPEGRDRDMELVIAKLDSIKAELDSIHQRIRKIEQHSEKPRTVW